MHSAFVTINRVPTRVCTWGKWIEESFGPEDAEDLVVCIPGNPGVTQFYERFLETVHRELGWPVWIVGHAAHERLDHQVLYDIPDDDSLYDLEGQVKHKIEFFEKYVPSGVRVHVVGHSVGSYITCRLLKIPDINKKITKSYLMFPTLEHIGDTPNGKFYRYFVENIISLILLLTSILILLPIFLQNFLIYIYILVTRSESFQIEPIRAFLNPEVLQKVLFLANNEMRVMKERDDDTIRNNLDRIELYYGRSDGWAPLEHYNRLKAAFPNAKAEVCKQGFSHAFVLHSSQKTGLMVADWMTKVE